MTMMRVSGFVLIYHSHLKLLVNCFGTFISLSECVSDNDPSKLSRKLGDCSMSSACMAPFNLPTNISGYLVVSRISGLQLVDSTDW